MALLADLSNQVKKLTSIVFASPTMNLPTAHTPAMEIGGSSRNFESKRKAPQRQFTPLPRPMSQLLPMLIENHLVAKEIPRDNPPKFVEFDLNKTCDYHMGERGHHVDNCLVLRYKIQNLLDKKLLTFKDSAPNVQRNPLPKHSEDVNMIYGDVDKDILLMGIQKMEKSMPFNDHLLKSHIVHDEEDFISILPKDKGVYSYNTKEDEYKTSHSDRKFVKKARDKGEVVDTLGQPSGKYNFMVKYTPPPSYFQNPKDIVPNGWGEEFEDDFMAMIEPVVIDLSKGKSPCGSDTTAKNVIEVSSLVDNFGAIKIPNTGFGPVVIELPPELGECSNTKVIPTFDTRAVPWNYNSNEIDAVTRSGRIYPPREGEEKKAVTDEEAEQLLKTLRTSEAEVIDQLCKMPAQISLLELFKTSEKHRNALLKILNEVHVPEAIGEVQLEEFVGAILLRDQITFSERDLPPEGQAHTKALYVYAQHFETKISKVMIDNGSALNICPLSTLRKLGIGMENVFSPTIPVRAFDGMKRETIGEIDLPLTIGPITMTQKFQVLDIPSNFSLLLGRPWIHAVGIIPSSLHQMMKLPIDGKIVTIRRERDVETFHNTAIPFIEPEVKGESSYHSFEMVSVTHVPVGSIIRKPRFSEASLMASRELLKNGFAMGKGLGKFAQGIIDPIKVVKISKRKGLGYQGDRKGQGNRKGPNIKGKSYQRLLPTPLKDFFPGPPKLLQEEEANIYHFADLFEDGLIGTINEDEEPTILTG
ncbi:uncharacterized protein LOC104420769 [Eucalyptus grandis]|uniref:uncharacterized protein LOC104420769 n=1 Tax=Eucalyptus grandis TaxID=71139 RepID=UPI00192EBC67|nr:uncharacterized protein LOC104420769 [Eucalyptus grandis]